MPKTVLVITNTLIIYLTCFVVLFSHLRPKIRGFMKQKKFVKHQIIYFTQWKEKQTFWSAKNNNQTSNELLHNQPAL